MFQSSGHFQPNQIINRNAIITTNITNVLRELKNPYIEHQKYNSKNFLSEKAIFVKVAIFWDIEQS
jgi:hypothetical protein